MRVLPNFIKPELATLTNHLPIGQKWLYEIKYDGYRLLAVVKNNKVVLKTRNNQDWTKKFTVIARALKKLPLKNAILDGELVALNKNGISKFQLLQDILQNPKGKGKLVYYVFDIPYDNNQELAKVPLEKRRQILAKKFNNVKSANDLVQYSKELGGEIQTKFKLFCKHGYEGIIAKNKDSFYRYARTKDWLKIKCIRQQEFVIGGYTNPAGSRKWFGALLLGYFDLKHRFIYCGKVGTGFDSSTLKNVFHHLKNNLQTVSPFGSAIEKKNVHWVKPKLVAEIKFAEWTELGYLRQPVFQGLRFDKPAADVIKEEKSHA